MVQEEADFDSDDGADEEDRKFLLAEVNKAKPKAAVKGGTAA